MRCSQPIGQIDSTVRGRKTLVLAALLGLLVLACPVAEVRADICALCKERPHLCDPKTLASCRIDKDKSSNAAGSPGDSGGPDRSPCGPNPPEKGFVYSSGNGDVRSDPTTRATTVGDLPRGGRFIYDRIVTSGEERWYHINTPGFAQGWVPSSDVACARPQAPPVPRPNRVNDCNVPLADSASAQGGARGFASDGCQPDSIGSDPVSFR